jgi:hypothetical protein
MVRVGVFTILALLLARVEQAAAQRTGFAPPTKNPGFEHAALAVSARIGNKDYSGDGRGECRHSPEASLRGVSAAMWTVHFAEGRGSLKELKLRLWRPKDGSPDEVSLSFETGSGSHRISTGGSSENSGEASVTVLPSGPGGRVEIKGKEADGKQVQLAIDCPAFLPVEGDGD